MLQPGVRSGLGGFKGSLEMSEDPLGDRSLVGCWPHLWSPRQRQSEQPREVAADRPWLTPTSVVSINVFESQICQRCLQREKLHLCVYVQKHRERGLRQTSAHLCSDQRCSRQPKSDSTQASADQINE